MTIPSYPGITWTPAQVENFTIELGSDFTWTSPPYILNRAVQNFSSATCRMMLRISPLDQAPALSLTSVATINGSVTPNGAAGTITIDITRAATASLVPGTVYRYDVFVDLPTGTSVRLFTGTMFVAAAITQ